MDINENLQKMLLVLEKFDWYNYNINMDKLFKVVANPKNPKILAIAKNYVKHVKEMGGDEPPSEPVIF